MHFIFSNNILAKYFYKLKIKMADDEEFEEMDSEDLNGWTHLQTGMIKKTLEIIIIS